MSLINYYLKVDPSFNMQLFSPSGEQVEFDFTPSSDDLDVIFQVKECTHHVRAKLIERAAGTDQVVKFGKGRNQVTNESNVGPKSASSNSPILPGLGNAFEQLDVTNVAPERISDYNWPDEVYEPIKSGTFFDEYISDTGGIMRGAIIMFAGDKGTGKSSVLINFGIALQKYSGARVLLISGEMPALRLHMSLGKYYPELKNMDIFFPEKYSTSGQFVPALVNILSQGWDIVLVDSMLEIEKLVGIELNLSKSQCEDYWFGLQKQHASYARNQRKLYTTFINIQQFTKGGDPAGTNHSQHMVDVVLLAKREKGNEEERYLIATKNRLGGPVHTKLFYDFGVGTIEYKSQEYLEYLALKKAAAKAGTIDFTETDMDENEFMSELLEDTADRNMDEETIIG